MSRDSLFNNAPAYDKLKKYTTIELDEENQVYIYMEWMKQHKEIPMLIPPVYEQFVFKFSVKPGDTSYSYDVLVTYNESLTAFIAIIYLDGKKIMALISDYNQYTHDDVKGTKINGKVEIPYNSRYETNWLQAQCELIEYALLAVQAYILYHRPDIVTVPDEEEPDVSSSRTSDYKPSKAKVRKIKDVRYIHLHPHDTPPKEINYRKIQWQVRGHYRHTTHNGEPVVIYIKPQIRKRGDKKEVSTLVVEATKD